MTLKLVADNGATIEIGALALSAELRDLADRVDAGEYLDAVRIIAVVETDCNLAWEILGRAATGFEILGILEAAKSMTLSPDE